MGFDISWHPISESELKEWYFDALDNENVIDRNSAKYGMGDFFKDKYFKTVQAGRSVKMHESFDKSHAYFAAVVQGFFRTYFYTRNGAFTFAVEEDPAYWYYTKPWREILSRPLRQLVENKLTENYCGGVYIPADKVAELLHDIENNAKVREFLQSKVFSGGTLKVFVKALTYAKEASTGLLEASEVVEPNPLDLNSTSCYSNLRNCDPEGALLYAGTAARQAAAAAEGDKGASLRSEAHAGTDEETVHDPPDLLKSADVKPGELMLEDVKPQTEPEYEKEGFFKRLFRRK